MALGTKTRRVVVTLVLLIAVIGLAEAALRIYGFGRGIRYQPHPTLGWQMAPGQRAFNIRGRNEVRVNAQGFRGPELPVPRPPAARRILFLGDGSTLANQFAEAHTYPFRVQAALQAQDPTRHVDVAVGAASGYQLEQHLEVVRLYAASLEPTVIVVGFCWNDWAETTMRAPGQGPLAYAEYRGPQNLWERTAIADFASRLDRIRRRAEQSRAYAKGEQLPAEQQDALMWSHVSSTLDSIAVEARRQDAALMLLIIPARMAEHHPEQFAPRKALLANWAAAHGVQFVDPQTAFDSAAAKGAMVHLDELHPGPDAHPTLAEFVVRALGAPASGSAP